MKACCLWCHGTLPAPIRRRVVVCSCGVVYSDEFAAELADPLSPINQAAAAGRLTVTREPPDSTVVVAVEESR